MFPVLWKHLHGEQATRAISVQCISVDIDRRMETSQRRRMRDGQGWVELVSP